MTKKKESSPVLGPILIRPMKKGDGKVVWAMAQKLHVFHGTEDAENTPLYFEKVALGEKAFTDIWIGFSNGKPLGYLLMDYRADHIKGTVGAYIQQFFIEETFRGKGIGRCFLAEAALEAKARKVDALVIGAMKSNKRANKIYAQAGFKLIQKKAVRKPEPNLYKADFNQLATIAK